jgi:hypothetical protein
MKLKSRGFRSAHGFVCLFRLSGHSARAGQSLAKKVIKVKVAAGTSVKHRPIPFHVP